MSKLRAPRFVRDQVTALIAHQAQTANARFRLGDLDQPMHEIIRAVEPFTLTSGERVAALCESVDYVVDHDVPGAFVECGLWRGGSLMAVLLRLRQRGVSDRDVVGFDTFTGQTDPTLEDVDLKGRVAGSTLNKFAFEVVKRVAHVEDSRDEVFTRLVSTGYPAERIHLIQGPVEDTLPEYSPEAIALLRLDTDYYDSTRHELEHLYPRISTGGVMIIDDYGHFKGQRKAVDEYFTGHRILLQRVDYSCRLAIKQEQP